MKRVVIFLCVLTIATGAVMSAVRPATPMKVGQTTDEFTLDDNEGKDFYIQLPKGSYYVILDAQRLERKPGVIFANVELLKSSGVMIKKILRMTEEAVAARGGSEFKVAKTLSARLRVTNTDEMFKGWLTVVPSKQMKFIPYSFEDGALKPLAVGPEGKGGTLGHRDWAYHSIGLPAGTYDVSLYFRQKSGKRDSLIGYLDRFDKFGFRVPLWQVAIGEVGIETRKEKQLVLTKPETVVFRVTNNDAPVEYVIGIEKG